MRCLVLEPTRELALQVEEAFQKFSKYTDLTTTIVYGGVGYGKQREDLKRGIDVLAATPGRLLDLLGDVNLKIDRDLESNPKLLEIFKDTASEMGKSGVLYRYESPMKDDHIPFKRKSVRVIDLIDFQYRAPVQHGPNTPEDGKRYTPWWHTADDTLDKVSKDSLDFVGNLVSRALARIEAEFYR